MISTRSEHASEPIPCETPKSAPPAAFWLLLIFFGILPWLLIFLPFEIVLKSWSGRDFDCLWVAGRMVLYGHATDVFSVETFQAAYKQLLSVKDTHQIYSYPPHALFLAVPFSILPYPLAYLLWNCATLAFFVWAARPFLSLQLRWWMIAFSPAAIICMGFGHYGLLVSGLFLLSFRGSGLAAAAMTFKPHLGLLVAVQMLRDREALPYAIFGTAALVCLSVIAFGPSSWVEFFTTTVPHQLQRVSTTDPRLTTVQVTPALGYGLPGQVLCALTAIFLLSRCFNVFTAATATFLISPYGFHYDMPAASLGFAYLIAHRWNDIPLWQKAVAGVGFCIPALAAIGPLLAPPALIIGLYVQTEEFRRRPLDVPGLRKFGTASPERIQLPDWRRQDGART